MFTARAFSSKPVCGETALLAGRHWHARRGDSGLTSVLAARDEKQKKMVVDLDDNVWAVHPMNIGPVDGKLSSLKSHFCGQFSDFWEMQPLSRTEARKYNPTACALAAF